MRLSTVCSRQMIIQVLKGEQKHRQMACNEHVPSMRDSEVFDEDSAVFLIKTNEVDAFLKRPIPNDHRARARILCVRSLQLLHV